jgi:hypothetical protein
MWRRRFCNREGGCVKRSGLWRKFNTVAPYAEKQVGKNRDFEKQTAAKTRLRNPYGALLKSAGFLRRKSKRAPR